MGTGAEVKGTPTCLAFQGVSGGGRNGWTSPRGDLLEAASRQGGGARVRARAASFAPEGVAFAAGRDGSFEAETFLPPDAFLAVFFSGVRLARCVGFPFEAAARLDLAAGRGAGTELAAAAASSRPRGDGGPRRAAGTRSTSNRPYPANSSPARPPPFTG